MGTETEVHRLLDQLVKIAPDRMTRKRALKMRARLGTPMEEILAKVPGETIIDKASYLGVSRQTVYAWIDGVMRPNLKRSKQIAKVTGFSVEAIRASGA